MFLRLGEPQNMIISAVAANKTPVTLQKVADELHKTPPTILESLKPLLEMMILRSKQAYKRGPRSIMLSEMGAIYAISHFDLRYRRVYENHPYLKMPDMFKELENCMFSDRLRDAAMFYSATLMWDHFHPFRNGTILEEYYKRSLFNAAVRVMTIEWILVLEPQANEINKKRILSFLEKSGSDFKEYLDDIIDKVERCGKANAPSKAEKIEKVKSISKSEAESKLKDTIRNVLAEGNYEFPSVTEEASADQKASRRNSTTR